ncbi:MAG: hypothetical protein RDU20_23350, partial [Desulfomonilaceae bacterium]|nr:hypothetical protein [Desulfomonilaceae bacterium]
MVKRQNPTSLSEQEFQERFDFLREFVGHKWLEKRHGKSRLFKDLWERRDFLASTELFTIAEALRQFDKPDFREWTDDYKNTLKSADGNALISRTHELVSAYTFCNEDQKVTLCPPGHPGYDFTVSCDEKSLRVSCKRILVTETEKLFYRTCERLYGCLIDSMQRLKVNAVKALMWFTESTDLASPSLAGGDFFDQTLKDHKRRPSKRVYEQGPCSWAYYPLPPDPQNMPFYSRKISAVLICVAPHLGNEQKRFEDNFRRAAKNLKKQSQTEETNNLILFGLPPSVSIKQATGWLVDKFFRDYKSIGGVLLTRKVPVVSVQRKITYVAIEYSLVLNPESSRNLDYGLKLQLPIGVFESEEPKTAFVVNDKVLFETGSCYHFQKGQMYYHDLSRRQSYDFSRVPGVEVT